MVWTLILDGVVIALLAVGIFYAWRLERLLRGLDKNRKDMQNFVATFSASITRAEKGIHELQDTAQDTGLEVDRQIARAVALRDELSYLIDAADKIASRLTDTSSAALQRPIPPAPPPVFEPAPLVVPPKMEKIDLPPPPPPAPVVDSPGPPPIPPWAKRATQDQVVHRAPEKPPAVKTEKTQIQKAAAALREVDVLPPEKIAARSTLRSQAERDLQKALEKIQ